MSNDTVVSLAAPAQVSDPLTELLRSGARRLIEAAVTAEFEEYLSGFVQEKLPDGRQRVVRNGHLPERKILTGLGEVEVRVPTVVRLGLTGALHRTLRSTNAIENLNGSVERYTRNVKRWRGGEMIQRWVSAALLDAEQRFRRVRGFRDMPRLMLALDDPSARFKQPGMAA